LKKKFLIRLMGEVRPVYGFWNQNATHGCAQCLSGAKTSLLHHKNTGGYADNGAELLKNRGFLSATA